MNHFETSAQEAPDGSWHEPYGMKWRGEHLQNMKPIDRADREMAEMPRHPGAHADCDECKALMAEAEATRAAVAEADRICRLRTERQRHEERVWVLAREVLLAPIGATLPVSTMAFQIAAAFIAEGERRMKDADEYPPRTEAS